MLYGVCDGLDPAHQSHQLQQAELLRRKELMAFVILGNVFCCLVSPIGFCTSGTFTLLSLSWRFLLQFDAYLHRMCYELEYKLSLKYNLLVERK